VNHLFWLNIAEVVVNDSSNAVSWQRPLLISVSCLFVLFVASRTIQHPHVGAKMPLGPLSPLFNDISVAGFIASMSFGHILGALLVLKFLETA
jgi:photosystem I subunit X